MDAHLAFNLILAVVAWPFSRLLSDLMIRLLPDPQKSDMGPKFLDVQQLSTPVMALAGATREVLSIGDLVERMLMRMSSAFQKTILLPQLIFLYLKSVSTFSSRK